MKNVKIYTKDNCPKCNEIKSLLTLKKVHYEEMKLTGLTVGKIMQKYPEARSAPIVTINEEFIDNNNFIKMLK